MAIQFIQTPGRKFLRFTHKISAPKGKNPYTVESDIEITEDELKELAKEMLNYLGSYVTLSDEGMEWFKPTPEPDEGFSKETLSVIQESIDAIESANENIKWVVKISPLANTASLVATYAVKFGGRGNARLTAVITPDGKYNISRRDLFGSYQTTYLNLTDLRAL